MIGESLKNDSADLHLQRPTEDQGLLSPRQTVKLSISVSGANVNPKLSIQ